MNYDDLLREKTKLGFERFINFIREDKNLLYDIDETEDDETEVNVEIFDDEVHEGMIPVCIEEFYNNEYQELYKIGDDE